MASRTRRPRGTSRWTTRLDQGVNFLDTAELYSIPPKAETQGSTERIIGTWFKARRNRDKVILASKVVGRTAMDWFREDKSPGQLNRAQMTEALEGSLKRLQTDYIDLYQLHWPDRAVPWGANPTVYRTKDYTGVTENPIQENPIPEILDVLGDFVKAGQDPPCRPLQRERMGHDELPARVGGRVAARRLHPECL